MSKCTKVVFDDKTKAKIRCKQIRDRSDVSLKPYYCDKCGKYHLTSQTASKQKETKKRIFKDRLNSKLYKEDYYNEIYGI